MQAVILCGGLGTRLRNAVTDRPKAMAPLGQKPFLYYVVQQLKKNGFNRFLFLTGYKAEFIERYFSNGDFSREIEPLGTGGALLKAFPKLEKEFCLLNGDTFFDIDYKLLLAFVKKCKTSACLALRASQDIQRYGYIELTKDFKVQNFIEKTSLPKDLTDGYINGGIYYFRKNILAEKYEIYRGKNMSLEKEILPDLARKGLLYGLPLGGKFIDIGIPTDYRKAQTEIPQWLAEKSRPALFLDRDGTIIKDAGYVHGKNLYFYADTINLVRKYQQKNYWIIVISNQSGIAKDKFTIKDAEATNQSIYEKYLEEGIQITKIIYCPYHPDGIVKKYKKRSIFRKPEAGMILSACEEFKIDIAQSLMYGDNKQIDKINLPYLKSKIKRGK